MKKPLTIVKIGGNVIDNSEQLHYFLEDFSALPGDKILVHGGGKVVLSTDQICPAIGPYSYIAGTAS